MEDKMNSTISYYNTHAKEYSESTVNVDLSICVERFLEKIKPGSSIMDIGSGSGRDLKLFRERGYLAQGIDASESLAAIAQKYSNCPVQVCNILDWKPNTTFDAYWANASLLHLKEEEILQFFKAKTQYLKDGGIIYFSMRKGDTVGYDEKGRYYTPFLDELLQNILKEEPALELLDMWTSTDSLGRDISWVSVILKKKPIHMTSEKPV